jgi:hypothetical protein
MKKLVGQESASFLVRYILDQKSKNTRIEVNKENKYKKTKQQIQKKEDIVQRVHDGKLH